MSAAGRFIGDLIIGGIVFLLPIGIVIVVFSKLIAVSAQLAAALNDALFSGGASDAATFLLSIVFLAAIAAGAGIFARTAAGRRTFEWCEQTILARLPIYTLLRQTLADMTSSVEHMGGGRDVQVVAVHLDDQTVIAFLVDTLENGRKVVFLPGSPSATSGTVAIVDADRVEPAPLGAADVINGMRRLGRGIGELAGRRSA